MPTSPCGPKRCAFLLAFQFLVVFFSVQGYANALGERLWELGLAATQKEAIETVILHC